VITLLLLLLLLLAEDPAAIMAIPTRLHLFVGNKGMDG